jgi:XapX domain-containing protein
MTWQPYVISLVVGLGIGVIYGLVNVRSPAPPIIALLGLLGILVGETMIQYVRGHPNVIAQCLHLKSFAVAPSKDASPSDPPSSQA